MPTVDNMNLGILKLFYVLSVLILSRVEATSLYSQVCDSPFWPAGILQKPSSNFKSRGGRNLVRSLFSQSSAASGNQSFPQVATRVLPGGGRKMLADEADLLWQISHAEIVSGKEGEGVKLWKLMEEHAKFKQDAADAKKASESFPSKWKRGIVGKISSDPSKLKPAWCKNIATCNLDPSVNEIMTSVR
jgi:hypothetical protein